MRLSRRFFLAAGSLVGTSALLKAAGAQEFAGDSCVASAMGDAPRALVQQVVAAFGGARDIIHLGDRVLVTPTAAWPSHGAAGVNTNPAVFDELLRLILEQEPREVVVLEAVQGRARTGWLKNWTAQSSSCRDPRVRTVESTTTDFVVTKRGGRQITVHRAALEADIRLAVPIFKHHRALGFSGAVHGCLTWTGGRGVLPEQRRRGFLEAVPPHLILLDATESLVAGGPDGRTHARRSSLRTILASRSPDALDRVAFDRFGRLLDASASMSPADPLPSTPRVS